MLVPKPPQNPQNGLGETMKPCPNCLRITEHDHMPGNRLMPGYFACSFCGWATPEEDEK